MPEHRESWEKWSDRFFLELLDKSLNGLPTSPKPLFEMSEQEIHSWLEQANFKEEKQQRYKITVPPVEEFCKKMQSTDKSDVINLPLSLEDNSTLTGTAAILDNFANEFTIPQGESSRYIEFNNTTKEFDLKSARERYYFIKSFQLYQSQMIELEKQLESNEKEIHQCELQTGNIEEESDDDESDSQSSSVSEGSLAHEDTHDRFASLFKKVLNMAQQTVESGDELTLDKVVLDLSKKQKELNETRDKFERTVFHAAVEGKRYTLVNILLSSGTNPNVKEGCGATPLTIAVLNSDIAMCKLLVENFAEYEGEMFGSFPSPLEMAIAMDGEEIVNLFKKTSTYWECPVVSLIQKDTCDELVSVAETLSDDKMDDSSSNNSEDFIYKRSECKKFPTAVVGDVGTCKNNRSVRNKDSTRYGWCTEIPGDMHAKGYLCEAAFKAHGSGGLHKLLSDVMKRPKLTKEAFKKRKFQDNNLNRIKEGVRDASQSYGMAAVMAFERSSLFPSSDELKRTLQKYGNHNNILLQRFREWLKESAEKDKSNAYHQQLFTLFGPLLALFIVAGKYGDGHLREVVWVILLPLFAQLGFTNYWTEAFVHVVNFTSLWPLAFRELMISNSTINLSGKTGHNVDLDEYVETYIVRPLKTYVTGKCTFKTFNFVLA
jgi:hypothetical protein